MTVFFGSVESNIPFGGLSRHHRHGPLLAPAPHQQRDRPAARGPREGGFPSFANRLDAVLEEVEPFLDREEGNAILEVLLLEPSRAHTKDQPALWDEVD